MNILETAIDAEGGVGKLADALGVAQNVVSNWRARGVPDGWALALQLKYAPTTDVAPITSQDGALRAGAVRRHENRRQQDVLTEFDRRAKGVPPLHAPGQEA